jgi:hypothetical protein
METVVEEKPLSLATSRMVTTEACAIEPRIDFFRPPSNSKEIRLLAF